MQANVLKNFDRHIGVVTVFEAEHGAVLLVNPPFEHCKQLVTEDFLAIFGGSDCREAFTDEFTIIGEGINPLPLIAGGLHPFLGLLLGGYPEYIPPAPADRTRGVVILLDDPNIPDALFLEPFDEIGVPLLDVVEQLVAVDDWGAAPSVCGHVAVETDVFRIVLVLGQLVVQRDWLAGWALVCGEHLQRLRFPCVADDQVADCSTTNILELSKAQLVQN